MADTIFALSSGSPPAALGIVRISGPEAVAALGRLTPIRPQARRARLARLRDPVDGALLDEALVLVFPGPGTATGEDLVELHCHGGRAVVAGVLEALGAMPGLRHAEPGEFTRRAFLTGRMDLPAVEALGDLLAAETALQRRQALRQSEGGLSQRVEQWQAELLLLAARIEASIDYAEEGGETAADEAAIRQAIGAIADEIGELLASPPAERLRDGVRVVLAGPPNAGKSTLLNALCGRDAAIVSPLAGTTRDRIEAPVTRAGIPFLLTDTAGLRRTDDAIEQIGVDRATDAIGSADILLWLGEGVAPDTDGASLLIAAKADIHPPDPSRHAVSAHEAASVEALWSVIVDQAHRLLPAADAVTLNGRQTGLMRQACDSLHAAAEIDDIVLTAACLRRTLDAFDRITGKAGVEDMLSALFGRFCVGK